MSTPDNARPLDEGQEWFIGGQDRQLDDDAQLEQLASYIDAHYELPDFTPPWKGGAGDPAPADNYCAQLPDRVTHAAMMVLGTGVDHSLPGVAFTRDVEQTDLPELPACQFSSTQETAHSGTWVVSLHSGGWWRGSGSALEMQWRPEVAAAVGLSGAYAVDLDYPLAPQHTVGQMLEAVAKAVEYCRAQGADKVVVWGYSSGAALAALAAPLADALVLTFPDFDALAALPDELRAGHALPDPKSWPTTFLQLARQDEVAAHPDVKGSHITTRDYAGRHRFQTPTVMRQRVSDVAEFLRGVSYRN
ncbi:alpha/beta hydrolase [Corynebacterium confusum]|uniref:alpha/beta hydrolase n=1 Tax=Corynebacterium confusum TaxID=71254 RepID=UPI0025B5FA93|nr:alpha/beta hydrolase fold domain-containing protein [Corynebacterium confusum]WJY88697.1 alpha/beta hydrolase fold protein [Corynebacterium confusum]